MRRARSDNPGLFEELPHCRHAFLRFFQLHQMRRFQAGNRNPDPKGPLKSKVGRYEYGNVGSAPMIFTGHWRAPKFTDTPKMLA